MVLAYHGIKPTYEAIAQFRIEPGEQALFAKNVGLVDFIQYRESQLAIVLSPPVLSLAIADYPELMSYPRLARRSIPKRRFATWSALSSSATPIKSRCR